MNIQIHSIHFNADQKLIDFVLKKIDKLSRYNNRIIGGEVFLKLDKSDSLNNKVVEIKLQVPGNDIFVKRQCQSFEEATDEVTETLRRQLQKRKEKSYRSMSRANRNDTSSF